MNPGKLGEILKHMETQNELLPQASESRIQELSKLRITSAMDPGKLGEILKHLEMQNELLTQASESTVQELSKLRGEEEMMMRKYYTIMSEHGKVKKVQELHKFWQQHGHGKISTDSETGNSTALVAATSREKN